MMHPRSRLCRIGGFTLLELMIAVGIIAVLLSILIPTITRVRLQSQQMVCASNMRSLGVALNSYVVQNRGTLPNQPDYAVPNFNAPTARTNFLRLLSPHLGGTTRGSSVFYCPTVLRLSGITTMGGRANDISDTNYVGNGALLGLPIAKIRTSSDQILIQEFAERVDSAELRPAPATAGTLAVFALWHDSEVFIAPSARFQGETMSVAHGKPPLYIGGNLLFVDGHAEYRRAAELRSGNFGLKPDEIMTHTNSVVPDSGGFYLPKW